MKFSPTALCYLLFILLSGCANDPEEEILLDPHGKPCRHNIGEYLLLPASLTYVPYAGKDSITFIDSLGNSLDLDLIEDSLYSRPGGFVKYNVYDTGDTVWYCYVQQIKKFELNNDSLNLHFKLDITATPFYDDPLKEYIADIFSLRFPVLDTINHYTISHLLYRKTINQRTFPINWDDNVAFNSLTIFGKEFLNVEKLNYEDPLLEVFYNTTEGMVSFKDLNGKTWRFDSMQ